MKKLFFLLVISFALFSCNGNARLDIPGSSTNITDTDAQSACFTDDTDDFYGRCHPKIDGRTIIIPDYM